MRLGGTGAISLYSRSPPLPQSQQRAPESTINRCDPTGDVILQATVLVLLQMPLPVSLLNVLAFDL